MISSMHLILSSFSTSEDKSACQRKLSKKISGIIKIESSGKNRIQYVQNNKIFLTTNIQKSMLRTTEKKPREVYTVICYEDRRKWNNKVLMMIFRALVVKIIL